MSNMSFSRTCSRRVCVSLMLAIVAFGARLAEAQPPQPQPVVTFVFPAGASRGQTVEATINGRDFQNANGVRITGPGVTAKHRPGGQPERGQSLLRRRARRRTGRAGSAADHAGRDLQPGAILHRRSAGDQRGRAEHRPGPAPGARGLAGPDQRPDSRQRPRQLPLRRQGGPDDRLRRPGADPAGVPPRHGPRLSRHLPDPL